MGVGGQPHAPTASSPPPPEKTRYLFYRMLGVPKGRSGRAENLVLTGIRSRTVQPVAQSLYRLSHHDSYVGSEIRNDNTVHSTEYILQYFCKTFVVHFSYNLIKATIVIYNSALTYLSLSLLSTTYPLFIV